MNRIKIIILFIIILIAWELQAQNVNSLFNTIKNYCIAEGAYEADDYEVADSVYRYLLNNYSMYLGDSLIGEALSRIAQCCYKEHEYDKALAYAKKAHSIQKIFDQNDIDLSVERLIFYYSILCKEYDTAYSYLFYALDVINSRPKHKDRSEIYTAVGDYFYFNGIYDSSLKYYKLSNRIKNCDPTLELYNYRIIAKISNLKGDYKSSLIYYNHILRLTEKLYGEKSKEHIKTYNSIGIVYYDMDDYEKAEQFFNKYFIFLQEIEYDPYNYAVIHNNLADIYRKLGNKRKAIKFFRKAISFQDDYDEAIQIQYSLFYHNIANVYKDLANYDSSLYYYKKSLKIRKQELAKNHYLITQSLWNTALVYYYQDSLQKAEEYLAQAINSNITEDTAHIGIDNLGSVVLNIEMLDLLLLKGKIYIKKYHNTNNKNNLVAACTFLELALELSENMFDEYTSIESQISLNRIIDDAYNDLIFSYSILIEHANDKKYENSLFQVLTRSKNAVLYRLISKYYQNQPDSSNRQERTEKKLISDFYSAQISAYIAKEQEDETTQRYQQDNLFKILQSIDSIKEISRFSEGSYFDQINLENIQDAIDKSTSIIDYYYNDSLIYYCVFSKNEFHIRSSGIDNDMSKKINEYCKSIVFINLDSYFTLGRELYKDLILPIKDLITNSKSLIIIPHQELNLLPFETLLMEGSSNQSISKWHYLINDYNISYNYSSGILYHQLFNEDSINYTYSFTGFAPFSRKTIQKGMIGLEFSDSEISIINDLFESNNQKSVIHKDSSATELCYKNSSLNSKIIHLATHGLSQKEIPVLSGLLFSEYFLENSLEDGVLYPKEIYSIPTNTDLLVLGACESGIGKIEKGEGMMSIVRSLYFSGTRNIILSLFKIPDKQTKELMVSFYQGYLKGNTYSHALREAKLKLIENETTRFPAYWGGLILVGK